MRVNSKSISKELKPKNIALIKARNNLNLTLEKAGRMIGINATALSAFEHLRKYPSRVTQERICNFYRKKGEFLYEPDVFPESMHTSKRYDVNPIEEFISLNKIVNLHERGETLLEFQESVCDLVIQKETFEALYQALNRLPVRKQEVLIQRYGLDGKAKSYAEIGRFLDNMATKNLGVTRDRTRQILFSALRDLRSILKNENPLEN